MKEKFENEDEILGLVRKRGLLRPSDNFTSRVMAGIEEVRESAVFKPLLSKKAWVLLVGGFILAMILCWYILSGDESDTILNLSGQLDRLGDIISNINFSFRFDANALLIITLAIISMGVLLSIDLWFSNYRKDNAMQ